MLWKRGEKVRHIGCVPAEQRPASKPSSAKKATGWWIEDPAMRKARIEHRRRDALRARSWLEQLDPLIPVDSDPNRSFLLKFPGSRIDGRDETLRTPAEILGRATSSRQFIRELDPASRDDVELVAQTWRDTDEKLKSTPPHVSFLTDMLQEVRRRHEARNAVATPVATAASKETAASPRRDP